MSTEIVLAQTETFRSFAADLFSWIFTTPEELRLSISKNSSLSIHDDAQYRALQPMLSKGSI
jgi:hypothetical protein